MACSQCDPANTQQRFFAVAGPFGDRVFELPYVLNASDPYYAAIAQVDLRKVVVAVLAGMRENDSWCRLYMTVVDEGGISNHQEFLFPKDPPEVPEKWQFSATELDWQKWMYFQNIVTCTEDEEGNQEYAIAEIPEALQALSESAFFRFSNVLFFKEEGAEEGTYTYGEMFQVAEIESAAEYLQVPIGSELIAEINLLDPGQIEPADIVEVELAGLDLSEAKRANARIIAASPFYKES